MITITNKQTEYKTANYRIQIEINGEKSEVAVFDRNNNLLLSCLSIKEAETISREILEVLEQLKI